MKPSDVKKYTNHSSSTIYKAKNGKLKNPVLTDKIMTYLNMERNIVETIFFDDRFIEAMEVVIAKAKSDTKGVELRKFAALAQQTALSLRNIEKVKTKEGDKE